MKTLYTIADELLSSNSLPFWGTIIFGIGMWISFVGLLMILKGFK